METIIKILADGTHVCFGTGNFDNWCVFTLSPDGMRNAHSDRESFEWLVRMGTKYTPEKVYADYVRIYDQCGPKVTPEALAAIDAVVATYPEEDRADADRWFTLLYGATVAEENKVGMILKKRIKRLGVYQALMTDMSPEQAARFSNRKNRYELDPLMRQYGF